jgi:hypothetical protein
MNHPHPPTLDDPSRTTNHDEIVRFCRLLNLPSLLPTVSHGGGFDRDVDWAALAQHF